jgi:hypothetical protein
MAVVRSLALAATVGTLVGAVAPACGARTYECSDDPQCATGDAIGTCEPTGFCSFPDAGCDSGRRYGELAGELSDQCVPIDPEDTGTSGPTSASSTGPITQDGGDTTDAGSGDTLPVDGTAGDTTGSSTSGPDDSTTFASTTDGTSTTGPTGCFSFEDDFERPDALEIGNGWTEKDPGAFAIVAERADNELDMDAGNFEDNLVYRPTDESLLDVDLSIEVRWNAPTPSGHPQLHARVQGDDIDVAGVVHSYVVFIDEDNGPALSIARVADGGFEASTTEILPAPFDTTVDYLLSCRVTGTDPVLVEATLERWDGLDWQLVAEHELEDADPARITTPGTVAFSGDGPISAYSYDAFDMAEADCP